MNKLFVAFAIVFALIVCTSAARKGVLPLDAINFNKIVDGKYNTLVQLAEYDWKLDSTYSRVAESFADRKDVLIASVETSGENEAFVKDMFGAVDKASLPKTFWIPAGKTAPEPVSGNDAEFLTDFVSSQLNPKLIDLKNMAAEFVKSDKKADLLKKAQDLIAKDLKGVQYAEWVVATMRKVNDKGAEFLTKEKARLEGLVSNKSTLPAKQVEFRKRINVLNSFQYETSN